jgi:alanine racemase
MDVMSTEHQYPRAQVTVDLDAIAHNVRRVREVASPAQVMAVVKADGYGHGAVEVARTALTAGATWIGACSVAEALALRAAGIDAPIFAWLDTFEADYAAALRADVQLSASSTEQLAHISDIADSLGIQAKLHLKIDTGLSRGGCAPVDWAELVTAAAKSTGDVIGIWSHLACADEPGHPSIDQQAQRFAVAYEQAREAGLNPIRHLANSAAAITRPDLRFDLVRLGIAMYGLDPVGSLIDFRPAMKFSSSIVLTKRIAAGESVSYGQTWTATKDTTIALLPVGYADGVTRALSGKFSVQINGKRYPQIGRVCMDQILVDCGDDHLQVGDEAVLFGAGTGGEPTAKEWADIIGTIDYEVVTGMHRPRLSRVYVKGAR